MEHIFNSNTFDFHTKTAFSPLNVRVGFARKVFGILGIQLLFTFFTVVSVLSSQSIQRVLASSGIIFWASLVTSIVSLLALSFSKTCRKNYPYNYATLAVFTLAESIMVAYICMVYETSLVLMAFGITAFTTAGLAGFALFSKNEITIRKLWPLFAVYSALNLFLLFTWSSYSILHLVYSVLGCIVFSVYLVVDIQRIVSGKRGAVSVDDYVYGAVSIYLDIINLFIKILQILDKLNESDKNQRRRK